MKKTRKLKGVLFASNSFLVFLIISLIDMYKWMVFFIGKLPL